MFTGKILEKDVDEFRQEMGIQQPPDLRNMRKEYFAKKNWKSSCKVESN